MFDTLIFTAAGKSSRYQQMRPKWLLTHPDGRLMGAAAMDGLPKVKRLIFVTSKEIANEYGSSAIAKAFLGGLKHKPKKFELYTVQQTFDQVDTVSQVVREIGLKSGFAVKDSDNCFELARVPKSNFVATAQMEAQPLLNAVNKCYVKTIGTKVTSFHEREVVSNTFACGLYGFQNASSFLRAEAMIRQKTPLFLSHVLNQIVRSGGTCNQVGVKGYTDWGTKEDWFRFKAEWKTLFIDVDGVLFFNGSQYFEPNWANSEPIKDNVARLNHLKETGKVQVILTTARPEEHRLELVKLLKKHGVKYDSLVCGLFHAKRVLINDFANSHPYPTAEAINIKRNSNDLTCML